MNALIYKSENRHYVEHRVFLWLHQWLSYEETQSLIWSMSWHRLVTLVLYNQDAILRFV